MKDFLRAIGLLCSCSLSLFGSDRYIPFNTQELGREPLAPEEAAAMMQLPEGFSATLFAGEPDVRQPIAMKLDEGDSLVNVAICNEGQDVLLSAREGKAPRCAA